MRRIARILAGVLVLAACGGGGGGATSETIKPEVRDALTADVAVLQLTDLSGSFSSNARSTSSSDAEGQASPAADKCFQAATGLDQAAFDNERTATAKRVFQTTSSRQELVTVEGKVEIFRDAASLTSRFAAFSKPPVRDCLKQIFVDVFAKQGAKVDRISVGSSKIDDVGDESVGFAITGPVTTAEGIEVAFGAEFHLARVGRAEVEAYVFSLQVTPDHSLAVAALTKMARRVQL
jgi:hypothetical protein